MKIFKVSEKTNKVAIYLLTDEGCVIDADDFLDDGVQLVFELDGLILGKVPKVQARLTCRLIHDDFDLRNLR